MKILYKSILFLLFLNTFCYSQDIEFVKENITFSIEQNRFLVNGHYWFINKSNNKVIKRIFFPIKYSVENEMFDSLKVTKITLPSELINYGKAKNGVYFMIEIAPMDTSIYNIMYMQKIFGNSVQYILTSTKEWHKPLEKAIYQLIIPKNRNIKKTSIKFATEYLIDDKKIYYSEYDDFLPMQDMIIELAD